MKRRKQWSLPPAKRTTENVVPFTPKKDFTFGKGYNPKAARTVKPLSYAEKKWHDDSRLVQPASWTNATVDWPTYYAVDSINKIAQGDTGYERNGTRINAFKLTLRGAVQVEQHASSTYVNTAPDTHYFRWIVFIDSQCNGAGASLDDLFQQTPNNLDQFDVFNSLYDTGRFKILMDKFIRVPEAVVTYDETNGQFYAPGRIVHFKKTFNFQLPIQYGDSYANMSSVRTNNIGMVIFSGNAVKNQALSYRTRLRYCDY